VANINPRRSSSSIVAAAATSQWIGSVLDPARGRNQANTSDSFYTSTTSALNFCVMDDGDDQKQSSPATTCIRTPMFSGQVCDDDDDDGG
jgi:hypothetical protein